MTRDRYLASLADAMGLEPTRFDRRGTSVATSEDRRGERLSTHYRVGDHAIIWVDPEIENEFAVWNGAENTVTFDALRAWMLDQGAVRLGAGFEHLLPDSVTLPSSADEVVRLDPDAAATVELIRLMQADCSEADNEEADFDLDALDRFLVGWVENGQLLALAGGRPWDARPGYHDIGLLVHPEARLAGRGRSVIAAVAQHVIDAGGDPLYRCNVENEGSWRLCRGLGFELVVELEAFTWPG